MEKDFLHVQWIEFLLDALDDNFDHNDTWKTEYIIQQYNAEKEFLNLL